MIPSKEELERMRAEIKSVQEPIKMGRTSDGKWFCSQGDRVLVISEYYKPIRAFWEANRGE